MTDPVSKARALLAAATPGPWRIGDADTLNPRIDALEWSICHVYDADERPYDPDDEQVPLAPTPLADAALIAAAPGLLARLCDVIERLRAEVPLYVCVLCPTGSEWVGNYDAADHLGECPSCHSGEGILTVSATFPAPGTALRRRVDEVIADLSWDRLDAAEVPRG